MLSQLSNMQFTKILLFCVFLVSFGFCFETVASLDIEDCGSLVSLDNFQISNCDIEYDDACNFPLGTIVNVSFSIKTETVSDNFDDLINDVSCYLAGQRVELTVSPDPCSILNCPLTEDTEQQYSARVYVDPKFRPIGGQLLEWIMKSGGAKSSDSNIVCFNFKINFVNDGHVIIPS